MSKLEVYKGRVLSVAFEGGLGFLDAFEGRTKIVVMVDNIDPSLVLRVDDVVYVTTQAYVKEFAQPTLPRLPVPSDEGADPADARFEGIGDDLKRTP